MRRLEDDSVSGGFTGAVSVTVEHPVSGGIYRVSLYDPLITDSCGCIRAKAPQSESVWRLVVVGDQ